MSDRLEQTANAAKDALRRGALTTAEDLFRRLFQFNTGTAAKTNALALSGLARIALLRGDRALAKEYAVEALRQRSSAVDAIDILCEVSDGSVAVAWAHDASTLVNPRNPRHLADAWRPAVAPPTSGARRLTGAAHRLLTRLRHALNHMRRCETTSSEAPT